MDQKYKPPPAIPETVISGILTDTIATGSTGGLSWEGHGCSNLLHKCMRSAKYWHFWA
jgi:hypothetical protein